MKRLVKRLDLRGWMSRGEIGVDCKVHPSVMLPARTLWRTSMKNLSGMLIASFLLSTGAAFAAPPTGEEINKVMDYYQNGKDQGPVLLEFVPCLKVGKKPGEDRSSCVEQVSGPVKKKTLVNAWMRWMVPKGGKYEDLSVVFVLNGEPRETKDLTLETESTSYGAYKSVTMSKAGEWEIRVRRGDQVLQSAKVTVTD